jgi:hypothetical protein
VNAIAFLLSDSDLLSPEVVKSAKISSETQTDKKKVEKVQPEFGPRHFRR